MCAHPCLKLRDVSDTATDLKIYSTSLFISSFRRLYVCIRANSFILCAVVPSADISLSIHPRCIYTRVTCERQPNWNSSLYFGVTTAKIAKAFIISKSIATPIITMICKQQVL